MIKKTCLSVLTLALCFSMQAEVRLPLLFADNMVIQRNQPVAVWGWADPGEKVTVQIDQQQKKTKADQNGHWMIHLDPEQAGGPFQLIIKGKNTKTISNVLIGEIWICSGQSNMEFLVRNVKGAATEMEAADFSQIRHFEVRKTAVVTPGKDLAGGQWVVCSPKTVGNFTAVGYFFARELYRQLHVPIGLINSSWGGTHVETWTSRGAFEQNDEFKTMIAGMPNAAALDALAAKKKETLEKTILALQGSLPGAGEEKEYKDPAYDDSRWPRMKLPGTWEQSGKGLEDLDGIVWFRTRITIAEEDAGKPAVLSLGKIDDSDSSYVNGIKIGATINQYDAKRVYNIPAGILKSGSNVIAVRVEDTGGGGGLYGEPEDMACKVAGKTLALAGDWSFHVASYTIGTAINPNSCPSLLYNGMINPLIPYTIKGAIWYQGEANADRAYQYRKSFPLMIADWRSRWGLGNFPFYFVQLASWDANHGNSQRGSSWAELREAQTMTLSLPNTGMAVTTDIGESHDIHPKNKQDVGWRLAAIAMNDCYGKKMEYSGPVYQSMQVNGSEIMLTFAHTGTGLTAHDPYGYIKGFEIAGADHQFHYAKAMIKDNQLILFQDSVSNPVAVRYGWADDAGESNLFNKEGFPAVPFRTDQWPGVTDGNKYEIGK